MCDCLGGLFSQICPGGMSWQMLASVVIWYNNDIRTIISEALTSSFYCFCLYTYTKYMFCLPILILYSILLNGKSPLDSHTPIHSTYYSLYATVHQLWQTTTWQCHALQQLLLSTVHNLLSYCFSLLSLFLSLSFSLSLSLSISLSFSHSFSLSLTLTRYLSLFLLVSHYYSLSISLSIYMTHKFL